MHVLKSPMQTSTKWPQLLPSKYTLFSIAHVNLSFKIAKGPKIPMKYGRVDAKGPEDCPPEGNLPGKCQLLSYVDVCL